MQQICTGRDISGFTVKGLMASFPGEPGLASFIGAKDDGSGGGNRSYKSYKMFKAPGP